VFDRQLYLYETVGILIGSVFAINNEEEKTVTLLDAFISPLIVSIEESFRNKSLDNISDKQVRIALLQCQHSILAMGSIMKGIPCVSTVMPYLTQSQVFKSHLAQNKRILPIFIALSKEF
jgi:hypothetical protein